MRMCGRPEAVMEVRRKADLLAFAVLPGCYLRIFTIIKE